MRKAILVLLLFAGCNGKNGPTEPAQSAPGDSLGIGSIVLPAGVVASLDSAAAAQDSASAEE